MVSKGQEEPEIGHRRALHIPVLIFAGKFKMEFLPTVPTVSHKHSLTGNAYVRLSVGRNCILNSSAKI